MVGCVGTGRLTLRGTRIVDKLYNLFLHDIRRKSGVVATACAESSALTPCGGRVGHDVVQHESGSAADNDQRKRRKFEIAFLDGTILHVSVRSTKQVNAIIEKAVQKLKLGGGLRLQLVCGSDILSETLPVAVVRDAHLFGVVLEAPSLLEAELLGKQGKTSICVEWEDGDCPLPASSCYFAHGYRDLRGKRTVIAL
eukprot:TRINITY_DN113411_c0_g1_i1.p1 TRINITY_DN113411_c0_g1~~TRINITY_DN113411_c0_g1_i1.p1  ORF type:complete len:197 (-),score=25.41 TRINITY_DN113411_c0_g1_i1:169-759(-)